MGIAKTSEFSNFTPIPDLEKYNIIMDAHKKSKLVIFLGAGVSALWGCKRWKDLAEELIGKCDLNYWEKLKLKENHSDNPRKLITIAKHILGEKYFPELKSCLKIDESRKENKPDLFQKLIKINATFITTNIDENFKEQNIKKDIEEFQHGTIKPGEIYHLHGIISDEKTLVMTIDEYIKQYKKEILVDFIKNVFLDNDLVIIFMGYSLNELELIDFLIEKSMDEVSLKALQGNRYILLPCFRNESSLMDHEQAYFNKLSIKIIPYEIDEIGYDQLYEVIKKWSDILTGKELGNSFYKNVKDIDKSLAKPNNQNKKETLDLIENDGDLRKYFFRNVETLEWFADLKQYFKPETIEYDDNNNALFWFPLDYLEKISIELGNKPDGFNDYGLKILEIINDLVEYSNDSEKGKQINNYHIWWYVIKIMAHLPDETIVDYFKLSKNLDNKQEIERFSLWLETAALQEYSLSLAIHEIGEKLFPKCLNNEELNSLAPTILDIITKPRLTTGGGSSKYSIESNSLLTVIKKNKGLLGEITLDGITVIAENLKQAIEHDEIEPKNGKDYSHIWLRSLKENSRHINNPKEVLAIFLRDVLSETAKSQKEKIWDKLEKFLDQKEYPFSIFRRLVLYIIERNWEDFSDKISLILEKHAYVFTDYNYEVELYDLLKKYSEDKNKQSDKINKKILKCINDVPDYYSNHENSEKMTAGWKWKWFSALKNIEDFNNKNEEVKLVLGATEDYEPARQDSITISFKDKAPFSSVEEFLNISPKELIDKYFNNNDWVVEKWVNDCEFGPTKDGLKEMLQQAAIETPMYFTDNGTVFASVPPEYLIFIIRGLADGWKLDKEIDWDKAIELCLGSIEQQRSKNNIKEADYTQQYLKDICSLIEAGCSKRKHKMPLKIIDSIEQLFNLMVEIIPKNDSKKELEFKDTVYWALNTVVGIISASYIYFSLWIAGETKDKQENWGKQKYERFYKLGLEPYVWLGKYLLNFKYLDEEYTKDKVKELEEKNTSDSKWKGFMEGYLGYSKLQPALFVLMESHYKKLAKIAIFDQELEKRYIQHLVYFYLKDNLQLKQGSLFYDVLMNAKETNRLDLWLETADYLSSLAPMFSETISDEEFLPKYVIERILKFWKWTYENNDDIKSLLGDEKYRQFMSKLGLLLIYVRKLNEEQFKWMMKSIPALNNHHNIPDVIEYMTRYQSAEELVLVGKLFVELLEKVTPSYDKDHILLIVRRLYENKDPKRELFNIANNICDTYGRRGNYMLRDLYNEFNGIPEKSNV